MHVPDSQGVLFADDHLKCNKLSYSVRRAATCIGFWIYFSVRFLMWFMNASNRFGLILAYLTTSLCGRSRGQSDLVCVSSLEYNCSSHRLNFNQEFVWSGFDTQNTLLCCFEELQKRLLSLLHGYGEDRVCVATPMLVILSELRMLLKWLLLFFFFHGCPRERDFLGKCVARASSLNHPQCQEP